MDFSDKEKRKAFLRERGIIPIRIPIPLIINHINVYYIDGPTPILLDPCVFVDRAFAALEEGRSGLGRSVGDIGLVLLTHGHRDHSGLARRIREISGARVLLNHRDAPIMAPDSFHRYFERVLVYYREMGVSNERINSARLLSASERDQYRSDFARDDTLILDGGLTEGDCFQTGAGPLRVIETPGHTTGSTSFYLEEVGVLFSGDLISVSYDPLPLVLVDRDNAGWLNTYDDYMASLDILCTMDPALLLPGHGGAIAKGKRLVERIMAVQERAVLGLEQALPAGGERTVAALAESIYRNASGPALTNALNVVRGIAKRLAREGKVVIDGGRIVRL